MRRLSYSFIIAIPLFFLSQAYADDPWYVNYESGLNAIEEERWSDAVDLLTAALSEKPEPKTNAKTYGLRFVDYLPYLYRGVAYYHLGNYEQADADLQQSQAFGEANQASRDQSALTRLRRYSKLIEQKRQSQTLMADAVSLLEQQDFTAAKEKVTKVLALDPDNREAQKLLERIDNERLLQSQKQAPETQPVASSESESIKKRGNASSDPGTVAESKPQPERQTDLLKPKSESSEQVQTLFDEAVTAFEGGDLSTARSKLSSLSKVAPNHPDAKSYAAQIAEIEQQIKSGIRAYFAGNNDKAINELNAAERKCRTDPNLYLFLGCAYSAQYFLTGEEDEQLLQNAMANFQKVKRLDSDFKPDRRYFSPRIIALFQGN